MSRILVFAGSARKGSVNKKLAAAAAKEVSVAGAEVTLIDLADFDAPIYNGDLEQEQGIPANMLEFKAQIASHDGMLIVTPEYNGFVPPLLVNVLSWASRSHAEDPEGGTFNGKIAALAAASPGRLGGVRVVPRLRDALAELGVMTVPGFVTVPGAFGAFDEEGKLKDDNVSKTLKGLVGRLIAMT